MYCTNCGKDNAEGMSFCENCGTPLNTQPQGAVPPAYGAQPQGAVPPAYGAQPQGYQPNMKFGNFDVNEMAGKAQSFVKDKNNLPILAGIGAVVVLIIVLLCACTRSMNGAVNLLEKGINRNNGGNILDAMYPPKMQKEMAKELDMTVKELEEEMEDALAGEFDGKVKMKITDKGDKVDRDDLKEFNEYLEEYNIKASAAREDVEIETKYDGDTEEESVTMYKVGGKWYILAF